MYASFHSALGAIPVNAPSARLRHSARFNQFAAASLNILGEATVAGLPLDTVEDVTTVWLRVKNNIIGTSPGVCDAVFAFLELVSAAPFGMDVLGAYWSVHGHGAGMDVGAMVADEKAAATSVAAMPAGFADGLEFPAGEFGRLALHVIREMVERPDLDIRQMELTIHGGRADQAMFAAVAVLASCVVHDHLPETLEFATDENVLLLRLDYPEHAGPV